MPASDVPAASTPLADAGAFLDLVGPVYANDTGVLGIRMEACG